MVQSHSMWRVESPKAMGAALRALREDADLTQGDLAEALGTTRQRISRIEAGEVSAQVLLLLRTIRELGAEIRLERHPA